MQQHAEFSSASSTIERAVLSNFTTMDRRPNGGGTRCLAPQRDPRLRETSSSPSPSPFQLLFSQRADNEKASKRRSRDGGPPQRIRRMDRRPNNGGGTRRLGSLSGPTPPRDVLLHFVGMVVLHVSLLGLVDLHVSLHCRPNRHSNHIAGSPITGTLQPVHQRPTANPRSALRAFLGAHSPHRTA